MAKFDDAVSYVFGNEGGLSMDPRDKGNYDDFGNLIGTNHGISGKVARANGYTGPMSELTIQQAYDIYKADYWSGLDGIEDQRIATKILDIRANTGTGTGTKIAQRAANWFEGNNIAIDGRFGPMTLEAINGSDPDGYLEAIVSELENHYIGIVERDPSQEVYLRGWLNRAKEIPSKVMSAIVNNLGASLGILAAVVGLGLLVKK